MHSTGSASDKAYQLLAHGRWFSPGNPASSIIKTGRHDIAEILLKAAFKHQKSKIKILMLCPGCSSNLFVFVTVHINADCDDLDQ